MDLRRSDSLNISARAAGDTISTSLPLNTIGAVAVKVSIASLRILPWRQSAWGRHSFIRRSRFFALSKFLAWSRPIGAINFAEARSAPSKSVPMTVTPVRSAPPSWAPLREAPVKSAPFSEAEFEIDPGQVGAARVQPFEIGGFQHRAHEPHRLVAHVGAQVRTRDRGPDEARASEIGRNARLREVGAIEPRAKHLGGE